MRVLLVKTSSLGDVIHTLPAISDALRVDPGLTFDWVVEEAYADLPTRHPGVARVIPVALRRWRSNPLAALLGGEVIRFVRDLRAERYDLIIDAQGLIKSAVIAWAARGRRIGFNRESVRERLAASSYHHGLRVSRRLHAIARVRRLFSLVFNYPLPRSVADFGLCSARPLEAGGRPCLMFLHGTAWQTKLWPEPYWVRLTRMATDHGFDVRFPWGSDEERLRAKRIIAAAGAGVMSAHLELPELIPEMMSMAGVVGGDSGLVHLAAACGLPVVALYGPTDVALTGAVGERCSDLAADFECSPCLLKACTWRGEAEVDPPCFTDLTPERVWQTLERAISR